LSAYGPAADVQDTQTPAPEVSCFAQILEGPWRKHAAMRRLRDGDPDIAETRFD
jgi:hypothetical protein